MTGGKGQPLPRGTRFITAKGANVAAAAAGAPYYQYNYTFFQCDAQIPGCNGWKIALQIQGVYNGSYVYQWNLWCTPSGSYFQSRCTWKGYFYNGGAYQSWCGCVAMQFGENSESSGSYNGTNWYWEAGQRVWVDVFGTAFDHTQWY